MCVGLPLGYLTDMSFNGSFYFQESSKSNRSPYQCRPQYEILGFHG